MPEAVIDRAFAASRRFHAMPLEEKLELRLNENNIGYLPINASVQGASTVHKATRPNQNESFFISHDRGPDHPDVIAGTPLRGRNQWPDGLPEHARRHDGVFQGARRDVRPHAAGLRRGARHAAPTSLRRSSPTRRTPICASCTTRRRTADEDNLFGQAPHTDNSFMTALARTDVPGLAVRLPLRASGSRRRSSPGRS